MGNHLWTRQRLRLVTCVTNRPLKPPGCRSPPSSSFPSDCSSISSPPCVEPAVPCVEPAVPSGTVPGRASLAHYLLITGHRRLRPPPNDQSSTIITLRTSPLSSENIDDSSSRESSSPTIGPVRLLVTTLDALTHPLGKVSSIL